MTAGATSSNTWDITDERNGTLASFSASGIALEKPVTVPALNLGGETRTNWPAGGSSGSEISNLAFQILGVSSRVDVVEGNITTNASEISNLASQVSGHVTATNPHGITPGMIGAVSTNDVSVTNARPWLERNYNLITNPPAIPSTNTLASTNWVIAQGYGHGTITGATIATGAAPAIVTNGGILGITVLAGGGGGSITYGTTDTTAYRGDWGTAASNKANSANTTANAALPKSGGIMTGPLTNNVLIAGNGAGLTNLSVSEGTVWTNAGAIEVHCSPYYPVRAPSLPEARSCLMGANDGANIWTIGGYDSTAKTNMYRFDGSTWTEFKGLPAARYASAAVYYNLGGGNQYIWVFGGKDGTGTSKTNAYRYSVNSDSWTEIAGLPVARNGLAAIAVPGGPMYIYIMGGGTTNVYRYYYIDHTYTEIPGLQDNVGYPDGAISPVAFYLNGVPTVMWSPWVYQLNLATTNWTRTINTPENIFGGAATVIGDRAYISQGTNLYRFDGTNFTALPAWPQGQIYLTAETIGNSGYLIGGGDPASSNVYRINYVDPRVAQEWKDTNGTTIAVLFDNGNMTVSGFLTNNAGFYGNGAGLTNLTGITNETALRLASDAGISNAYIAADAGISNAFAAADTVVSNALTTAVGQRVLKSGDTMTGPLTNNAGFFGNGVGLTNVPVPATNTLNSSKLNLSGDIMIGPLTNNVAIYGNGIGITNAPNAGTFNHVSLTNQNGNTNFQHLTQSEKDLVTNSFALHAGYNISVRTDGTNAWLDSTAGGTATNGATLVATNMLGQTKWSGPVYVRAYLPTAVFTFTNAVERNLPALTVTRNVGNTFDGTTFFPPVNGEYYFEPLIHVQPHTGPTADDVVTFRVKANGSIVEQAKIIRPQNQTEYQGRGAITAYLTNNTVVTFSVEGQTKTNDLYYSEIYTHLTISLKRELP